MKFSRIFEKFSGSQFTKKLGQVEKNIFNKITQKQVVFVKHHLAELQVSKNGSDLQHLTIQSMLADSLRMQHETPVCTKQILKLCASEHSTKSLRQKAKNIAVSELTEPYSSSFYLPRTVRSDAFVKRAEDLWQSIWSSDVKRNKSATEKTKSERRAAHIKHVIDVFYPFPQKDQRTEVRKLYNAIVENYFAARFTQSMSKPTESDMALLTGQSQAEPSSKLSNLRSVRILAELQQQIQLAEDNPTTYESGIKTRGSLLKFLELCINMSNNLHPSLNVAVKQALEESHIDNCKFEPKDFTSGPSYKRPLQWFGKKSASANFRQDQACIQMLPESYAGQLNYLRAKANQDTEYAKNLAKDFVFARDFGRKPTAIAHTMVLRGTV